MKAFLQSLGLVALGAAVALGVVLAYQWPLALTREEPPPGDPWALQEHFRQISERVAPSVVAVRTIRAERISAAEVLRHEGSGSGFAIAPDGLVLTNEHVVHEADDVAVILSDGRHLPAQLIGADVRSDLAVLRIDAELPPIDLVPLAEVRRGDIVAAMGNPLGVANEDGVAVFTFGTVSRAGIALAGLGGHDEDRHYSNMIQTSAPMSQGSSGGPLLDLRGRAVGVNTAVQRPREALPPEVLAESVGFAIPFTPQTLEIIRRLQRGQLVQYGWLGIAIGEPVVQDARVVGVSIVSVNPGGPADQAGLQAGDVVTHFNGQAIRTIDDLIRGIGAGQAGQTYDVGVMRRGAAVVLHATLADRAEELARWLPGSSAGFRWRGMTLRELPDGGVVVAAVEGGSPAAEAGLVPGDVIMEVAGRRVLDLTRVQMLVAGRGDVPVQLQSGQGLVIRQAP